VNPRDEFISAQQRMLDRYGVDAQSQFVKADSTHGQAHVLASGEGPPVVMVGGLGMPGAMWAPLMAELKGFRLYAVDLPGFGLTDTTPWFSTDLRFRAVRFLGEVLDGLELNSAAFLGNSLGSLWTSWLSLDLPKCVSALVHVGSPATAPGTSVPLAMRLLSVRAVGLLVGRWAVPSPRRVRLPGGLISEDPLVPEQAGLLVAAGRLPAYRQTYLSTLHALFNLLGSRTEMRLTTEQLARIRQPVLLIWGRDDPFGSPTVVGQRLIAAMPHAGIHLVSGRHTPWLRCPEEIGQVAGDFLRRCG
jgi:pimeloyl-ACP methyl ester carboxylesterase